MSSPDGGNIENALAQLIQNQAQFVANLDEDRRRFSRIENELLEIRALLVQHEQILMVLKDLPDAIQRLPDAIQKKIGFHKR